MTRISVGVDLKLILSRSQIIRLSLVTDIANPILSQCYQEENHEHQ